MTRLLVALAGFHRVTVIEERCFFEKGGNAMKCKGLVVSGAVLLAAVLLVPALWAGDGNPAVQAVRLGNVDGRVQISQDNQLLADPALVNTPLFEGSQITAMDEGRAELQFEDGSVARLSPHSALLLKALNGQGSSAQVEVELLGGLAYFELIGAAGHMRIRFGDSVVTASGSTVLRVNLDNQPGQLAVFSGNAHLERDGKLSIDLQGGESITLDGANPSRYNLTESIEPDSWDTWNADRDQDLASETASHSEAESALPNHGSQAWNDLDASGNWYNVPGEGLVWAPYEASNAGWDPYGNGYWMWTPRYSYIWISGDPWGYMPFQCGNWNFYDDFGWGWMPGGCNRWWGGGGYYPINIGHWPRGFRPPIRPRPIGGRGHGLVPLISVNHRPAGTIGQSMRGRNTPVTIAGQVVQPLRPLSPRSQYARPGMNYGGAMQSGGAGLRSIPSPVHSTAPAPRPSSGGRSTAAPSRAPSGGGGAPAGRSSGASAGGGGGSHSSGGGHH